MPRPPSYAGRRIALLGAGAVASALAEPLARARADLRVWSRSPRTAARLASSLGRRVRPCREPAAALEGAELVLVCVRDAAVPAVAREAASRLGDGRPTVLHTSGALDLAPLAPLGRRGCATGSLHPLVALPPRTPGSRRATLRGTWCVLAGRAEAEREGRGLVALVGGRELHLGPGVSRVRYHAAATLLAGGAVALLDTALEVLGTSGAPPPAARRALAGLLGSVAANLRACPPAAALTGPTARGDVDVVRAHLEALGEVPPEEVAQAAAEARGPGAAELYRLLALRTLRLAAEKGRIEPTDRSELQALLERWPSSSPTSTPTSPP